MRGSLILAKIGGIGCCGTLFGEEVPKVSSGSASSLAVIKANHKESWMDEQECQCGRGCCGSCCYACGNNKNEPCWGKITVVDEIYSEDDYWWIHACERHQESYDGYGGCIEKPK